ncbi:MAG: efflux RND transporter periplasmic adaptor subunit [bacterium]
MSMNKKFLLVVGICVLSFYSCQSRSRIAKEDATYTTQKGPLTISVTEAGVIKARDQLIIKNEVEGQTSILWLIAEGTRVEKGDLLIELDASKLVDEKIDQQIQVQNAEAAFINARENLAVVKNQAQSDIDKAALTLEFAQQDLKKYIEGEYPNQVKEAEAQITLAQEELTRAEETLKWSTNLYQEKYISESELQADELAARKKALDLELARNNLDLLKNFTYKRTLAQLESDVSQAEMALERVQRKARADVVQAEAELQAKESEFMRQKDKLAKIEKQIEKAKIYAPSNGLAIYATSAKGGGRHRSVEPLAEGQEVRERQELIYLPTDSAVKAEIDVHEANLKKVKLDLPVKITVDALPGKLFTGRVAKIAPLPDPQSSWLNPDLKVYNTEIYIDGNNPFLRTGMSCRAEIIIASYEEAVYVPLQAVLKVANETTVYVVKGRTLTPRKVEMGLDNSRMVHIISGLEEGETVLLTPPLAEASVEMPKEPPSGPDEPITKPNDRIALPQEQTRRPNERPQVPQERNKRQNDQERNMHDRPPRQKGKRPQSQ